MTVEQALLNLMKKLWIPALLLFGWACSTNSDCVDAPSLEEKDKVTVHIDRLEREVFKMKSPEELEFFIQSHPVMADEFLGRNQYPSDSILAHELFKNIKNPYVDTLFANTEAYFGDMADIKAEFEEAFSYLKHYYPSFQVPKIKTMVTGFGSSEMYVGKDEIIIGLDYYLGKTGKYRPPGIPKYILTRYDKPYIVPAVVLLYANRYLKENTNDHTMLADMIYYGKKYYFAKQMLPCTSDSLIVWYSGQQLKDVEENKDVIWYHFLNNQLLYETNHFVKKKYMDERPKVLEIGEKCPGRIGSWIGWDIVRAYMKNNPDVSLQELMANPDAKDILNKSKYKVF
ncbi:MAG: gliding motility lipoprotein GldB [Cyclobacteriaceae bacterium]|nr:gliding motility lipoprotein GldB [Cyclobacteriaceae bacterium]